MMPHNTLTLMPVDSLNRSSAKTSRKASTMPSPAKPTFQMLMPAILAFAGLFAVGCSGSVDRTETGDVAASKTSETPVSQDSAFAEEEAADVIAGLGGAPIESDDVAEVIPDSAAAALPEVARSESPENKGGPSMDSTIETESTAENIPSRQQSGAFRRNPAGMDGNSGTLNRSIAADESRQSPTPDGGGGFGGGTTPNSPGGFGAGGRGRSERGGVRALSNVRMKKSTAGGQLAKAQAVTFDLQPGEELWVIAKAAGTRSATDPDSPGCGSLMARLPKETRQIPCPLMHTSVNGTIDGYIATVNVEQQFTNPYNSKIEAVYVFPLPQNAAVNEFVMTVGDRRIRGVIREREKAEKIYEAAKLQGHVASLMTQERANIFTQKVANIEPGKQIDISVRYFNTLQYDDGAYEFVFPMVVGPRFNPAGTSDGVGAVPRNANNVSGQKTEVAYLAPDERSGHDISVSLKINAGVDIESIHCVNHAIKETPVSETQRQITLSAADSIPNKDFVLRYRVAGTQIKTALLTHKDDQGQYFTMMVYPPADLEQVERSPMEMVFVLDCSGSMRGKPLGQSKNAIAHALQTLTPRDTFQIIQFSNNASQLGTEPVLATDENIKAGLKYLYSLNGGGGTQMIEGIRAALDFPHDEGRFRLVSFMTDGFIGNEQQILQTLHQKLGESRIFSFGVGSSPNRMLMNRMALLGKGAVAYLSLNDDATEIMDRFNKRISHPAMTDLRIDWGNMNVADVYPQRLPDLIVGRPVVVTGRFKGEPGQIKINGLVAMEPASFNVEIGDKQAQESHEGIAAVWARLKIKDMMNTALKSPAAMEEIKSSVLETALTYNLMSSFTAFVAVDSMSKTEGDFGTTVAVPVPVPEGVKYETTVGGSDE